MWTSLVRSKSRSLTVAPAGSRRLLGCVATLGPVTVGFMDVTFTKTPGRRYLVTVERQVGPALAPRYGPGYDPHLPHDLVHFVVEAEAGLTGGGLMPVGARRHGIFFSRGP